MATVETHHDLHTHHVNWRAGKSQGQTSEPMHSIILCINFTDLARQLGTGGFSPHTNPFLPPQLISQITSPTICGGQGADPELMQRLGATQQRK